ncbi:hypothetical protein DPMN_085097 [Dreissena polymorpha]|uniref:Uncharacterized protein n=1 Tax=Dreissena polymorpha TaxID=45954 RepID=A0A9D3YG73_DREPO|nr:hypothetical protein DPMN_085097 [Dreissena polymorpha]
MDMDLELRVKNTREYSRLEVLLKHIAVVLSGLDSRVNKQHKIEKNNKKLPPTLPAVMQVITMSKEKFNTIMENIKHAKENTGKILNKTDVAFLNRHMTVYICLAQGQSAGAAKNMQVREFNAAFHGERVSHINGDYIIIFVANQKTADTHDCRNALSPYWITAFDLYYRYVRTIIASQKQVTNPYFFTQYDGNHYKNAERL